VESSNYADDGKAEFEELRFVISIAWKSARFRMDPTYISGLCMGVLALAHLDGGQ
jgi:hypothetical protein